jgi:hypothetical protein
MSPKHTNELIADKVYETWIDSLSPKSALKKLMKVGHVTIATTIMVTYMTMYVKTVVKIAKKKMKMNKINL